MGPEEKYKDVIRRSLLASFSPETIAAIFRSSEVLEITSGEKVGRSSSPKELFIVLEGEVELRTKSGSGYSGERIRSGQSLELASLFSSRTDWQSDWLALRPTKILKSPWALILQHLKEDPTRLTAISRVTLNIELQKLRRDMRIFCVSERAQLELISALRKDSFQSIFSDWGHKTFQVVSEGTISVSAVMDGRKFPVGKFATGDACLLDLSSSKLVIDADPKGSAWTISKGEIEKLKFREELTQYFKMFDSSIFKSDIDDDDKTVFKQKLNDSNPVAVEKDSLRDKSPTMGPTLLAGVRNAFFDLELSPRHDNSSSAAVCLASLTNYFGVPISPSHIDDALPRLKNEDPLSGLVIAANKVRFAARIRKTSFDELKKFSLPVILQFSGRYAVLVSCNDRFVKLADPELGRTIEIDATRFEANRSKNVLIVAPKKGASSRPSNRLPFFTYFSAFNENKYNYFLIIMVGIIGFFISLALPVLQQFTFDRVLLAKAERLVLPVIVGIFLLNVLANVFSWIESNLCLRGETSASAFFTSAFLAKVVQLPITTFARFGTGDLIARHIEGKAVQNSFEDLTFNNMIRFFSVLTCLAVLFLYHKHLAIAAVSLVPLQIIGILVVGSQTKKLSFRTAQKEQQKKNLQLEHMDSAGTLMGAGGSVAARWRWEAEFVEVLRAKAKLSFLDSGFTSIHFLCANATRLIILVIGAQLYFQGKVSIGQIVASVLLTAYIAEPIWEILQGLYRVSQLKTHLVRLDSLFTLPTELIAAPKSPKAIVPEPPVAARSLTFDSVSFRYRAEPTPFAIKEVSFTVKPGEVVAIVGSSGSGKSTIASLMNGTLSPTSGQILFGNQKLSSIPISALRKSIGVIDQEGALFSESIFVNLSIGQENPPVEKVLEAAQVADVDGFVARLPAAYATELGPEGAGLSEGQKQKIRIARTVLSSPDVLVMDESTSHLDSISEERVLREVRKKFSGKIIIFISHRLNLAAMADRVLVFSDGQLIEQGHHSQLIHKQGKYYELFCKRVGIN
jgi:ATP-binding cassette subfamily B protein